MNLDDVVALPASLTEKVILYATMKHLGAVDKMGQPYILHPLRVMSRMQTAEDQQAAVLHDVIEDTNATYDELRFLGVSPAVLEVLAIVTRIKGSETREQYEDRVLLSMNPAALRVKVADVEDNLSPWRRGSGVPESLITRYLAFNRRLRAALADFAY